MEEENFKKIQNRLKETNFRCGFACLFYGALGTGKTETVLQIARLTGRDLIQINVSDIKSMWVGESEKNIKGIFEAYKKKVSGGGKAPILLFNEADAIIGKRKVGAEESVERMENSIQNIILQEMERLDGILIATTNLAENMDKAFERRFLYKIKFERPDLTSRSKIWKSMIPQLSGSESKSLASEYDFSGGEIENVARHLTVQTILHGKEKNMLGKLREYCDSERLSCGTTKRKVGFSNSIITRSSSARIMYWSFYLFFYLRARTLFNISFLYSFFMLSDKNEISMRSSHFTIDRRNFLAMFSITLSLSPDAFITFTKSLF